MVENYAVVERVRVKFHKGLNLLTGETGSGKSIVVDAVGLALGGRASADMVRSDTARARISAIFEAPADPACQALLDDAGIPTEDGELLIEREVSAEGKSRAFAGNRPVTVAWLRSLAPFLADIHGQHEQQELFSAAAQLQLLDESARLEEKRAEVARLFAEWKRVENALEELSRSEQEKLRLADMWAFQRKELEAAGLQPGEDVELESERLVLKNVGKLEEHASAAYQALYDSPESAGSSIRAALKKLDELCRIDGSLAGAAETIRSAMIGVDEAADAVRRYLDRLEANPSRLEEVEARLAMIGRLKRKYGNTLEEVLVFLDRVRAEIETVETANERKAKLTEESVRASEAFEAAAGVLTTLRRAAAEKLSGKVESELEALALGSAVFRIGMEPAAWSEHGADRVEFLISANAGEEPRPLDKVASGGELSRIALALKTSTGPIRGRGGIERTLVFDEIDSGIGGGVAEAVGRRLRKLSGSSQVLCVTHLAQVAGFADHHYFVEKREVKGRTVAEIEELSAEARKREIGRMLSGQRVTPEALKHAEQLIRLGRA